LEGGAQILAVVGHRLLDGGGLMGQHGGETGGGFEQFGGLAIDDRHVALFGGIRVVAVHQLQHFPFGDGVGGLGEDLHHPQVGGLGRRLVGAAVAVVSPQGAGGAAKRGGGGRPAAAQVGCVDHVGVQQGGGVNEFDDGSRLQVILTLISQCAGGHDGQHGAH